MKVYFEIEGERLLNGKRYHSLLCYVEPDGLGGAKFYNMGEELIGFHWCNVLKAKCVDSSELPEDLWYSIRHGLEHVLLPIEKEDIDISEFIYEKVDPEQVRMYKKAKEAAEYINSIEELRAFYPQIENLKKVPTEFVRKVFKLAGVLPTKVVNGELGLAMYNDSLKFTYIINHLVNQSNYDTTSNKQPQAL